MTIPKATLPPLPYDYQELTPVMSAEILSLHHDLHHQAYVDGANKVLDRLEQARSDNQIIDLKASLKELSFHLNGHKLHSLFWQIMRAPRDNNHPTEDFANILNNYFHSWERFQVEFEQTALSVEGSGWAALMACQHNHCLILNQIEKHNLNLLQGFTPILVVDVWEHAYYPDYKNNRGQFLKNFWQIINWDEVAKRYQAIVANQNCKC